MRPRSFRRLVPLVAVLALAGCGSAASSGAATISDAWARPAAAGGMSAAYFTITNTSTTADALLSVSSPSAAMVQLHETSVDAAGVAAMHPVARVAVQAGGSVAFKPGSYHLMLMGLTSELSAGKTIQLDLVFEHAGKVVVQAEIRQG
jgi:copper(I)-binding protein